MPNPDRNPFIDLREGSELPLPSTDRFPAAGHLWDQREIDALVLAWAARRPLLVRGEAGSGKSQIARAAAAVLGDAPLLVEVIHPRFEALDLLYQVDVVARLADAHSGDLASTNEKYVKEGKLWQAITLQNQRQTSSVLLIDEIDKADAEVPNALLDVLGNRSFAVPPLEGRIIRAEGDRLPLIVITTNEERELPAAFVRRCAVLNVNPPEQDGEFKDWLIARGRVHAHLEIAETARVHAARQVFADRQASLQAGYPEVGLAEYIDLLTAIHDLTRQVPAGKRAAEQVGWLQRISSFALVKNAKQRQDRKPVEPLARTARPTDERA